MRLSLSHSGSLEKTEHLWAYHMRRHFCPAFPSVLHHIMGGGRGAGGSLEPLWGPGLGQNRVVGPDLRLTPCKFMTPLGREA